MFRECICVCVFACACDGVKAGDECGDGAFVSVRRGV